MAQLKMQMEQQQVMGKLQLEQAKIQLERKKLEYDMMIEKAKLDQKQAQVQLVEDGKERDSTRDMFIDLAKLDKESRMKTPSGIMQ